LYVIWTSQRIRAYVSKSTFDLYSCFGTIPPKHHTYHLLSLLGNMWNQVIIHRIQQHPLGLHFFLLMGCQFICNIWIWNHHLNVIFEIIFFKEKKNPSLLGPEICGPLQHILNSKSAHHSVQTRAQICSNKYAKTCVSRR
jgi:hypothetical protein